MGRGFGRGPRPLIRLVCGVFDLARNGTKLIRALVSTERRKLCPAQPRLGVHLWRSSYVLPAAVR